MPDQCDTNLPKLDTTTRLAFERNRLSCDRTVMSSVRTATSLITFGFTVYKFFQFELKGRDVSQFLIGPREFGITMIVIGLLSLSLAVFEYKRDMNALRKFCPDLPRSTSGLVAAMIAALGVLALIIMVMRQ